MAGTNVYLQLITATGPVIGEGLLEGWQGSIELRNFGWGAEFEEDDKIGKKKSGLGAGLMKMIGAGETGNFKMNPLTFQKRFDVASSQIHFCVDNHLKVISASITVLHIKHGGRALHQPGFVLLATNGYITSVDIKAQSDGNAIELIEDVTLEFENITMTYLKKTGKDNVPTAPFTFTKPKDPPST